TSTFMRVIDATMVDYPFTPQARTGRGEAIVEFETAVYAIRAQQVLGVIKWGYTVPDDARTPVLLHPVVFSKEVSPQFKALMTKANSIAAMRYKVGPPRTVPYTWPPGQPLYGGTSAVPDAR